MSIVKHIKEHSMLGISSLGANVITLANSGGETSSLLDAMTLRDTISHTLLTSFTATISGSSAGTVAKRVLTATSGTPLSAYIGESVGVRIDDAGGTVNPIVRGIVRTSSSIELLYHVDKDYTAVNIDVFRLKPVVIHIEPGFHEEITTPYAISPWTTLYCSAFAGASFYFEGLDYFNCSSNLANEIFFNGLKLSYEDVTSAGKVLKLAGDGQSIMSDFGLASCLIDSGGGGGLLSGGVNAGGLYARGNIFKGQGDMLNLGSNRLGYIADNTFIMRSGISVVTSKSTAIVLGAAGSSEFAEQTNFINNNHITCVGADDIPLGAFPDVIGIDIRNKLSTASKTIIANNYIATHNEDVTASSTEESIGVKVTDTASTSTPDIIVKDNIFNVTHAAASHAANVFKVMHSANANFVLKRAGNQSIASSSTTPGLNTSLITEF